MPGSVRYSALRWLALILGSIQALLILAPICLLLFLSVSSWASGRRDVDFITPIICAVFLAVLFIVPALMMVRTDRWVPAALTLALAWATVILTVILQRVFSFFGDQMIWTFAVSHS
jgi:hypothetical protein